MKTAYLFCLSLLLLLTGGRAAFADGGVHGHRTGLQLLARETPTTAAPARYHQVRKESSISEQDSLLSDETEDEDLVRKLVGFARYALLFCMVLALRILILDTARPSPGFRLLRRLTPRFLLLRVIRI